MSVMLHTDTHRSTVLDAVNTWGTRMIGAVAVWSRLRITRNMKIYNPTAVNTHKPRHWPSADRHVLRAGHWQDFTDQCVMRRKNNAHQRRQTARPMESNAMPNSAECVTVLPAPPSLLVSKFTVCVLESFNCAEHAARSRSGLHRGVSAASDLAPSLAPARPPANAACTLCATNRPPRKLHMSQGMAGIRVTKWGSVACLVMGHWGTHPRSLRPTVGGRRSILNLIVANARACPHRSMVREAVQRYRHSVIGIGRLHRNPFMHTCFPEAAPSRTKVSELQRAQPGVRLATRVDPPSHEQASLRNTATTTATNGRRPLRTHTAKHRAPSPSTHASSNLDT